MNMSDKTDFCAVGTVVRSKCGRDRKRVFVVIEVDPDHQDAPIVIANGRLRKIADRKHKNPSHLQYVAALDKSDMEKLKTGLSDGEIAEICDKHDFQ